jgi:hypothetical protein
MGNYKPPILDQLKHRYEHAGEKPEEQDVFAHAGLLGFRLFWLRWISTSIRGDIKQWFLDFQECCVNQIRISKPGLSPLRIGVSTIKS